MARLFLIVPLILIFLSDNVFASSKIYLIRHATVPMENPGWCSTQIAFKYKLTYNTTSVQIFDPDVVLRKIDHPETIDSVFCSPKLRAIQTANLLFGNQVKLNINENLMELDYPVIQLPLIKLPVKVWLTASLISWMAGNSHNEKPTYKQRKQDLENYSNELITFAETHEKTAVVAHGVVNRELIRILKRKGWKIVNRDGNGNLSVNCLIK